MSNEATTGAEANNWNDKISIFLFIKYKSNVPAMASDVNNDIV